MGRKNQQQALLAEPPAELTSSQRIGKIESIQGNNIYTVTLSEPLPTGISSTQNVMVELPPKFRNTMWIRRGGYVLIDCAAFEERANKLAGEIVTVIHEEKSWRKMIYWPHEFAKITLPERDDIGSEEEFENPNRRRRDSSDED